jgi:isoleucyl-tRNA synthetase
MNYELGEEYAKLVKDELNVKKIVGDPPAGGGSGEIGVELNTELTDELKEEGILRELTRTINGMRKDAGLTIDDFISLEYNTDDKLISNVFEKYNEELKKLVLASSVIQVKENLTEIKINDIIIGLKIEKV